MSLKLTLRMVSGKLALPVPDKVGLFLCNERHPIQITFQNFIDKMDYNFIKMFLREAAFSIK